LSDHDTFEVLMIRYNYILIFFFVSIASQSVSQENLIIKRNLQPNWLIHTERGFSEFAKAKESTNTIYFLINPNTYRGDHLLLSGSTNFSVMVNDFLLIDNVMQVNLPLDSLQRLTSDEVLFVAVHQNQKIDQHKLLTYIYSNVGTTMSSIDVSPSLRKDTSFQDFVVTAVLVLFIFLVSVIRLNPKLSSDYFSITKIFSLRESEDDQFYYRMTSTNILFYLLTSMIFSLFFLLVGQFIDLLDEFNLQVGSYVDCVLTWINLSLIVLSLLFVKIVVTFAMALLFGAREVAGFHFMNFIRLALVSVGLLTLVLVIYFLLHGQRIGFYNFLYTSLGWILVGWIILFFLKLVNRIRYSVFHLFSYICATEIIPVLLIIKVLYK